MNLKLTLFCTTCPAMVHGDEELHFQDPIYRKVRHDHGDLLLPCGDGAIEDLLVKAVAYGWSCDGESWRCGPCANPGTATELVEMIAHALGV